MKSVWNFILSVLFFTIATILIIVKKDFIGFELSATIIGILISIMGGVFNLGIFLGKSIKKLENET